MHSERSARARHMLRDVAVARNTQRAVMGAIVLTTAAIAALVGCAPAPAPHDVLFAPVALPHCEANADGRIEHDELPFVVGATARVRVGASQNVDVAGKPGRGSARVWDLSRP